MPIALQDFTNALNDGSLNQLISLGRFDLETFTKNAALQTNQVSKYIIYIF